MTITANALGQPTQVASATQPYASGISYFPSGALKQFTYGNGIVHTLTQNARNLPAISKDLDGATAVHQDEYAYDQVGNVLAITDAATGQAQRGNRSMAYDGLDRLTSTTSPMFGTAGYTYDVFDNLTHVQVTAGAQARNQDYCYDAAWRLTNVKTGGCSTGATVVGLGYDVQGNLANKNGVAYTFDYGNRLRAGGPETYRYDAHGRRVRSINGTGGILYSLYSQAGQLLWQRDERTSQRRNYVYLGASLLAEHRRPLVGTTETIVYQHTDALGSPVATTSSAKVVLQRSEYEPYGYLLNRPVEDGPGYTGHATDAATGLVYMQQRYYDPLCGCFVSTDPVGALSGPFNRYWYAADNPFGFTDPDGRAESPAWMRAAIPGMVTWDAAVTSVERGNYTMAAAQGAVAIAEGVIGVLTLGESQALSTASRASMALARQDIRASGEIAEVVSTVNPKSLLGRQGSSEMSGSQVKRLANDMKANGFDASKPIDLANVDGKKIIIDGHHRTAAAIRAGIKEIPARNVSVTPEQGKQLLQEAAEAGVGGY